MYPNLPKTKTERNVIGPASSLALSIRQSITTFLRFTLLRLLRKTLSIWVRAHKKIVGKNQNLVLYTNAPTYQFLLDGGPPEEEFVAEN